MSSKTILRIFTMFQEIIPYAPNLITTKQIEQELAVRCMNPSPSQLSRDLVTFADLFNVVECEPLNGNKCWQKIGKTGAKSKMPEHEIMCLTLLEDKLEAFPKYAQRTIKQKLMRMTGFL